VIYLYLDEKDSTTHALANLFGSLLKQLIQRKSSDTIPLELRRFYRKRKQGAKSWPEIFKLLKTEILTYERVYVIVDALDECPSKPRDQLEDELCELQKLQPGQISLMMTAREPEEKAGVVICDNCRAMDLRIYFRCDICNDGDYDLCQRCRDKGVTCRDESHKSFEPYGAVEVEVQTKDSDMEQYIKRKIGDDDGPELRDKRMHPNPRRATVLGQECRKDPKLLQTILSVVTEKAEGKLLFAKLYMDQLKHAKNRKGIDSALDSLPSELDDIYASAMRRIQVHEDPENRTIALKVLSLISRAHRHLGFKELQHALATDPGDTDFDRAKCYDKQLILRSTIGLIGISDYGDNADVRLLHFSLYGYLDKTLDRWFPKAEIDMANACLTYLNFNAFSTPSKDFGEFKSKKDNHPFIAYASQFWGDHVRDAGLDSNINEMVVRFLDEPLRLTASIQAAWSTESWGTDSWDVCMGVTDLHVCAWFGLSSVIPARVRTRENFQIDVRDMTYRQTPLMYACRRGRVEVARQLLDRGAAINLVSARGRTALFEAVMQNEDEVVKVLLEKQDLDINAVNTKEHDRTALMLAACGRHSNIVGTLLTHPAIQPNLQDVNGYTALCYAVIVESYESVETLLTAKVDAKVSINIADNFGRTPLSIAAMKNNGDIVKLLRQNHADPSVRDKQGGAPAILRAVDYGSIDVVKWMLYEDEDVDIQCLDDDGRGLLHSACFSGNADMVNLVGECDEVDLNAKDNHGMTALHLASQEGHLKVVHDLVELGADTAIEDHFGRTPLSIALQYARPHIASILAGDNENQQINPNQMFNAETSPIWLLIKIGRLDLVVQSIAKRKSDLLEKEPVSNNAALHYAVLYKNVDILRLLLEDDDLCPNPTNRIQRTPLHLAAVNGFLEATQVLLDHHADVNAEDQWHFTPLFLARWEASQPDQHFPIAVALIEAGADTKPIKIQEMFFAAVKLGRIAAVQTLLGKGADVLECDVSGQTGIELASGAGNTEMVQMLQSSKAFRYSEAERNPQQSGGRVRRQRIRPSKRTEGAKQEE
jgi:ankyrin repeat protein